MRRTVGIIVETRTPRKGPLLELSSLLGITTTHALGACVAAWLWFKEFGVNGQSKEGGQGTLDAHVGISGFCAALQRVGWLKRLEDGGLLIPGFNDHGSDYVVGKEQNAVRQRRKRAPPAPAIDTTAALFPLPILPPIPKLAKPVREYPPEFEEFWNLYPPIRRTKKGNCLRAWNKAIEKTPVSTIINAVRRFAVSPLSTSSFCPGPEPWLNGERWEDDPLSWMETGGAPSSGSHKSPSLTDGGDVF